MALAIDIDKISFIRRELRKKGKVPKRKTKNLKSLGISVEIICKSTGLSLQEVNDL